MCMRYLCVYAICASESFVRYFCGAQAQVFRHLAVSSFVICFCFDCRQHERKRIVVQPSVGIDRHLCYLYRRRRIGFIMDHA